MIFFAILAFVIILGLLIFVHELGHFVMAKRAGMRVDEFGFGFPPRLFGIRRGETIYSINWIPLGGFVKIYGEDGGEHSDPRAFGNKGFWARFRVLIAGVTMNFILGWFLIFLGFWIVGTPVQVGEGVDLGRGAKLTETQLSIIGVQADSPAAAAGFRAGDAILAVDGKRFERIEDLIAYNKEKAGTPVVYEFQRGSEVFTKEVVPRVNPGPEEGPVGFQPAMTALVKYPLLSAVGYSFQSFISRTWGILSAFGELFRSLASTGHLTKGLSGPVGIAVLTRDVTALGLVYLLQFTAMLSINLAILNAVPFPALDGGRILFLVIEKIRGVRSLKWEQVANLVGFALLILLMIAVTFGDVNRYSEQFKNLFERIM